MINIKTTYFKVLCVFITSYTVYSICAQTVENEAGSAKETSKLDQPNERVYVGCLEMLPGERLDWAGFKLSTAEMGFEWSDVVAYQEIDDRVIFLITDNEDPPFQLYQNTPASQRFTSTVRFMLGVSNHGKSRQTLKGCSRFEPLKVQKSIELR